MTRPKAKVIPDFPYAAEDRKLIAAILAERARLCDPASIEAGYKALARIRRSVQLLRANRAVAAERTAPIVAAYAAALVRMEARREAA